MGLLDVYHTALLKPHVRLVVVLLWLALTIAGMWAFPKFLDNTTMNFHAPDNTLSEKAQQLYQQEFPDAVDSNTMVVYVQNKNNQTVENNAYVRALTYHVNSSALEYHLSHPLTHEGTPLEVDVTGYYLLQGSLESAIAAKLVSPQPPHVATIILVNLHVPMFDTKTAFPFLDYLHRQLDSFNALPQWSGDRGAGNFTVGLTGQSAMFRDAQNDVVSDLEKMDLYILPFAILVLGLSIRSFTLLLITLTATPASMFVGMLVNYPLSSHLKYPSFAPSIFMSLVMAMSIDYSLFLLTRYKEETLRWQRMVRKSDDFVDERVENAQAVKMMLKHAGKTVMVSGSTLAITFLALAVFPTQFLSSIGVGACLTLLITMLCNLSLAPALLLSFPKFFQATSCVAPRATRACAPTRGPVRRCCRAFWCAPCSASGCHRVGEHCCFICCVPLPTDTEQDATATPSQHLLPPHHGGSSPQQRKGYHSFADSSAPLGQADRLVLPDDDDDEYDDVDMAHTHPLHQDPLCPPSPYSDSDAVTLSSDDEQDATVISNYSSSAGGDTGSGSASSYRHDKQANAVATAMATQAEHVDGIEYVKRVRKAVRSQRSSCWFRFAQLCRRHPVLVVVLLIGLGAPISYQCLHLSHTIDQTQVLPRNSQALHYFKMMSQHFPLGQLQPYHLLLTTRGLKASTSSVATVTLQDNVIPPARWRTNARTAGNAGASTVHSPEVFDHVSPGVIHALLTGQAQAEEGQPGWYDMTPDSFQSLTHVCLTSTECESIGYNKSVELLQSNFILGTMYREAWHTLMNPTNTCMVMEIIPVWDPMGDRAQPWVKSVRSVLKEFQDLSPANGRYSYRLQGGATQMVDAIDEVFALFPYMILLTTATVFLLISLVFRSVLLSFRLLFTISFTLSWIYGAGVLVFQEGILDWAFPVLNDVHAYYWMVPLMSFSILTGLTLDYDVFLMSRIFEYRRAGFSTSASIVKGVYKTGGIISSAGIIMMLAFSSLMLSSEMVLNQFGFLLCFSVLLDTFVVRPILVPSLMFLLGEYNWWPVARHMPHPDKDEWHFMRLE